MCHILTAVFSYPFCVGIKAVGVELEEMHRVDYGHSCTYKKQRHRHKN